RERPGDRRAHHHPVPRAAERAHGREARALLAVGDEDTRQGTVRCAIAWAPAPAGAAAGMIVGRPGPVNGSLARPLPAPTMAPAAEESHDLVDGATRPGAPATPDGSTLAWRDPGRGDPRPRARHLRRNRRAGRARGADRGVRGDRGVGPADAGR